MKWKELPYRYRGAEIGGVIGMGVFISQLPIKLVSDYLIGQPTIMPSEHTHNMAPLIVSMAAFGYIIGAGIDQHYEFQEFNERTFKQNPKSKLEKKLKK